MKLRKGLSAGSLQGVVWVAALPFHQGLTQAAGVCIGLTAPVFTDVICGVHIGDRESVGGHGRERERSTSSETCPGVNRAPALVWAHRALPGLLSRGLP